MSCWYCHWGWAKPVGDLYARALDELGERILCWGPSHIVFEDENFDDDSVGCCVSGCDRHDEWADLGFTPEQLVRLKEYLLELLAIPEHIRCCCPKDYRGENPENFPPVVEMWKEEE